MSTPLTITFPSLEAAVSTICENVFGAALVIEAPEPKPTPSACSKCGQSGGFLWGEVDGTDWRCTQCLKEEKPTYETETNPATLRAQRDNWEQTAARHLGNEQFYRGLLKQCADVLGPKCRTRDDGSMVPEGDFLALRVPEVLRETEKVVGKLMEEIESLKARIAELENPRYRSVHGEMLLPGDSEPPVWLPVTVFHVAVDGQQYRRKIAP